MITITELLLILLMAGLFYYAFRVCFRSDKGPLSMTNLKNNLLLLQSKFAANSFIDPQMERKTMEVLQNRIKTSCSSERIASSHELKTLFSTNCESINRIKASATTNRMDWLKYGELMNSFNEQYFCRN